MVEETNRRVLIRAGATEQGFQKRWKEHHKASKLGGPVESHRRFSLLCPDESVHEQVEGKRGKFQDLRQMVGLGMKRSQIDDILKLFDWSEREKWRLANLTWTSGFPGA